MSFPVAILIGFAAILAVGLFFLGWRWASRIWSLPCPSLVGWALESPFYERITGTVSAGTEKQPHRAE
jgi:hypothetical protein